MKQNFLIFITFFILIFFIGYNKIKSDEKHLIEIQAQNFKSQIFEIQFYFIFDEKVQNKSVEYFSTVKNKIQDGGVYNKNFIDNSLESFGDEFINYRSQKILLSDNHFFYHIEMSDLICQKIIDIPPRINEKCEDGQYKAFIY